MQQVNETMIPSDDGWIALTDILANHAARQPDALAVEARGERLSYAALAARVDRFAARLANGLPPRPAGGDLLIGVCLARNVDLPAWLFAILKVGGAYLPIDPTTPPARLAQVMEDAQPALIVASRCHAAIVHDCGVPVIIAEDEPAGMLPPAPVIVLRPDMLAYVIFTSGSTGRPKGVEIEHRSLASLMATMAIVPGMACGERMLGLTRISFDLSVPDMFLPFFVGGSLSLIDTDAAADPERLAAAFVACRPDLAQATPSTWRALLESGWQGQPGLRIVAGGEAVTHALADPLLPRCGELWNIYGPTETTVWSTACRVEPGDGPIPIGWPIAGYSVHVATAEGVAVPVGEVGEIVIGGIGVARGYRNRPDLTAERFVIGPDGARTYRTGDLGRVDETGALYCLGRLDDQVKVRGFRIELGDVEAALALHPAIGWSAARLWTTPSGDAVLVGYLVPRVGTNPGVREIKAFLATMIAPYMVPDRLMTLAVMPLTPNGKVDRAGLPDPFACVEPVGIQRATAGTLGELAAIWSELLGLAAVSAEDDFFDLGGYSLMTVRLTRRIEARFGVRLALIELLRHSTLAAMAARIDLGDVRAEPDAMLLNSGGTRPSLFWLDAGPLMRTLTRGLSPDQPAYALNLDPADEDALGQGVVSIVDIATVLKTRLVGHQRAGPYYIGGWCRWGIVAFELARQLEQDGETVGLLVLLDADRPGAGNRSSALRSRLSSWLRAPSSDLPTEPESFSQRVQTATTHYRPQPYAGDVLLLRPLASSGDTGWRRIVSGDLVVERTPGDHVSMVRGAAVGMLAATLDEALLAAQSRQAALMTPAVQAASAIA